MKKTVLGVLLVLCASVGLAQKSATPEITAPTNGAEWLKMSSTEKLFWAVGYSAGYQEALGKIDVTSGTGSPCAAVAVKTARSTSPAGKVNGFELVSGLERFYSDPANTVIPIGSAVRIYLFQQAGKDEATIQELIDTARMLGAQARTTAQK